MRASSADVPGAILVTSTLYKVTFVSGSRSSCWLAWWRCVRAHSPAVRVPRRQHQWPVVMSLLVRLAAGALILGLAQASNVEGQAYLAENTKKDGVVTLPGNGLQYRIIKSGPVRDAITAGLG